MIMKDVFKDLPDLNHELLDDSHCREAKREQSEDHGLLGYWFSPEQELNTLEFWIDKKQRKIV